MTRPDSPTPALRTLRNSNGFNFHKHEYSTEAGSTSTVKNYFLLGTDTRFSDQSGYPNGETLSALHHSLPDSTIVDGPQQGALACSNSNSVPSHVVGLILGDLTQDPITHVNITGHSRGAVGCLIVAHELDRIKKALGGITLPEDPTEDLSADLKLKIKAAIISSSDAETKTILTAEIDNFDDTQLKNLVNHIKGVRLNLYLLDPVPGNSSLDYAWTDPRICHEGHFAAAEIIENIHTAYAQDERTHRFDCAYVQPANKAVTNATMDSLPGHHGTASGCLIDRNATYDTTILVELEKEISKLFYPTNASLFKQEIQDYIFTKDINHIAYSPNPDTESNYMIQIDQIISSKLGEEYLKTIKESLPQDKSLNSKQYAFSLFAQIQDDLATIQKLTGNNILEFLMTRGNVKLEDFAIPLASETSAVVDECSAGSAAASADAKPATDPTLERFKHQFHWLQEQINILSTPSSPTGRKVISSPQDLRAHLLTPLTRLEKQKLELFAKILALRTHFHGFRKTAYAMLGYVSHENVSGGRQTHMGLGSKVGRLQDLLWLPDENEFHFACIEHRNLKLRELLTAHLEREAATPDSTEARSASPAPTGATAAGELDEAIETKETKVIDGNVEIIMSILHKIIHTANLSASRGIYEAQALALTKAMDDLITLADKASRDKTTAATTAASELKVAIAAKTEAEAAKTSIVTIAGQLTLLNPQIETAKTTHENAQKERDQAQDELHEATIAADRESSSRAANKQKEASTNALRKKEDVFTRTSKSYNDLISRRQDLITKISTHEDIIRKALNSAKTAVRKVCQAVPETSTVTTVVLTEQQQTEVMMQSLISSYCIEIIQNNNSKAIEQLYILFQNLDALQSLKDVLFITDHSIDASAETNSALLNEGLNNPVYGKREAKIQPHAKPYIEGFVTAIIEKTIHEYKEQFFSSLFTLEQSSKKALDILDELTTHAAVNKVAQLMQDFSSLKDNMEFIKKSPLKIKAEISLEESRLKAIEEKLNELRSKLTPRIANIAERVKLSDDKFQVSTPKYLLEIDRILGDSSKDVTTKIQDYLTAKLEYHRTLENQLAELKSTLAELTPLKQDYSGVVVDESDDISSTINNAHQQTTSLIAKIELAIVKMHEDFTNFHSASLDKLISEHKAHVAVCTTQIANLTHQLEKTTNRAAILSAQLVATEKATAEAEAANAELVGKNHSLAAQITALHKELSSVNAANAHLTAQLAIALNEKAELERALDTARRDNAALNAQLEVFKANLTAEKAARAAAEAEAAEVTADLNTEKAARTAAEADVTRLATDLEAEKAARAAAVDQVATVKAELGTEKAARAIAEAEVATSRTAKEAAEAEVATSRTAKEAAEAEAAASSVAKEAAEAEVVTSRTAKEAAEAEVVTSRTAKDAAEADVARLTAEKEAEQAAKDTAQTELAAVRAELDALRAAAPSISPAEAQLARSMVINKQAIVLGCKIGLLVTTVIGGTILIYFVAPLVAPVVIAKIVASQAAITTIAMQYQVTALALLALTKIGSVISVAAQFIHLAAIQQVIGSLIASFATSLAAIVSLGATTATALTVKGLVLSLSSGIACGVITKEVTQIAKEISPDSNTMSVPETSTPRPGAGD